MNLLVTILIVFIFSATCLSQEVTVTATVKPKQVKSILSKEREAARINRAFFDEQDKCRAFIKERELRQAETSCRAATLLVERLPTEHILERSSARTYLGIALLMQNKAKQAIPLFEKALEIRIPRAGESDADTADIYSWLGTAHGLLGNVQSARANFERAESGYRSAFVVIGDDCEGLRFSYPRRLRSVLEAHHYILEEAGLIDEADKLQLKLDEVEKDFARYLGDQEKEPAIICN